MELVTGIDVGVNGDGFPVYFPGEYGKVEVGKDGGFLYGFPVLGREYAPESRVVERIGIEVENGSTGKGHTGQEQEEGKKDAVFHCSVELFLHWHFLWEKTYFFTWRLLYLLMQGITSGKCGLRFNLSFSMNDNVKFWSHLLLSAIIFIKFHPSSRINYEFKPIPIHQFHFPIMTH